MKRAGRIIISPLMPTPVRLYPLTGMAPSDISKTTTGFCEKLLATVSTLCMITSQCNIRRRSRKVSSNVSIFCASSQLRCGAILGAKQYHLGLSYLQNLPPGHELPEPFWKLLCRRRTHWSKLRQFVQVEIFGWL